MNNKSKIQQVNDYINNQISNIDQKYQNQFHINVPCGWMNDPNGLCYAFNKYHVFFQYNPFNPYWGPMHWGHYVSDDLITWEWAGVALVPEEEYDNEGCFSGTGLFYNDTLYILYTGISKQGTCQTQVLASSKDGIHFTKHQVVIDGTDLPSDVNNHEFRDPKIFIYQNKFYALIGSKKENTGVVVLYESINLYDWKYKNIFWEDESNKGVCECPDIYLNNGETVLFYCRQNPVTNCSYKNCAINVYKVGKADFEKGIFTMSYEDELDYGSDFYSAQLFTMDNVFIGWMGMWNKEYPTASQGWVGSLTLPRQVIIENGIFKQLPHPNISKYYKDKYEIENVSISQEMSFNNINNNPSDIYIDIDLKDANDIEIDLFKQGNNQVLIKYDKQQKLFSIDAREYMKNNSDITVLQSYDSFYRECNVDLLNNHLVLRIIIDVSSIEIFINNGIKAMSMLIYKNIVKLNDINSLPTFNIKAENCLVKKLIYYPLKKGE